MRPSIVLLILAITGCTHVAPDSSSNAEHLRQIESVRLDPGVVDSPIVLQGCLRANQQKGWPTKLDCVGARFDLQFPPPIEDEDLASLDGATVRVRGLLRSQNQPASLGQQGHPARAHVRYYVDVASYEVVKEGQ